MQVKIEILDNDCHTIFALIVYALIVILLYQNSNYFSFFIFFFKNKKF